MPLIEKYQQQQKTVGKVCDFPTCFFGSGVAGGYVIHISAHHLLYNVERTFFNSMKKKTEICI